jgi:GDPmannose 4,6-dehydratase
MDIEWSGAGSDERGVVRAARADSLAKPGQCIVAIDSRYFRPAEVETLLGDAGKARERLGWTPATSFEMLVREMVAFDLELAKRDALTHSAGFRTPAHHE